MEPKGKYNNKPRSTFWQELKELGWEKIFTVGNQFSFAWLLASWSDSTEVERTSTPKDGNPRRGLRARSWLACFANSSGRERLRPTVRWEFRAKPAPLAEERGELQPMLRLLKCLGRWQIPGNLSRFGLGFVQRQESRAVSEPIRDAQIPLCVAPKPDAPFVASTVLDAPYLPNATLQ
jgi:hypothetical protein